VIVERGVKPRASAALRWPPLDVDGLTVQSVRDDRCVTTYLATPDHRLRRWGVSLRHRTGEGWTVKLPLGVDAGVLSRAEHVFAGADPRRVPRDALDLVAGFLRGARPRPVVRLRTERRSSTLASSLGDAVATVTDDRVVVDRGRSVRSWLRRRSSAEPERRFRELEVELVDGAEASHLDGVVAFLRAAGAGPVDPTAKLDRALGDAPPTPEVAIVDLDDTATVAEVVRSAIARSVVRLIEHDPGVRVGDDPEAVHQARVATRRLRSDLRTFRDVVDRSWADHLRAQLRGIASALGEVRDAEVLLERLRSRAPDLGPNDGRALDLLLTVLDERRREARVRLLRMLRDRRYLALLDDLVDAATEPRVLAAVAGSAARTELRGVMRRPWKRLRRAVELAGETGTNAALHQTRIHTKRVRYAAEALAPVFGKPARRFAGSAAELQTILGEHQDAVVADRFLRTAGGRTIAEAFVAGELAQLETRARVDARAAWRPAWEALSDRRLRFWA